jgi:D-glycero-D-manno-heptose 1,7-bisphosphate phosphatase
MTSLLRPALFLDRDGTLTRDAGYTFRVADLDWLPGAQEAIVAAQQRGALVILITNQSGIGRGYYTEADMDAFHAAMQADLAVFGARLDALYHCPFIAEAADPRYRVADHPDRKPNPGMLLRAIAEHGIDPAASLMVGDQDSDLEAARRAGVPGLKTDGRPLDAAITPWLADLAAPRS